MIALSTVHKAVLKLALVTLATVSPSDYTTAQSSSSRQPVIISRENPKALPPTKPAPVSRQRLTIELRQQWEAADSTAFRDRLFEKAYRQYLVCVTASRHISPSIHDEYRLGAAKRLLMYGQYAIAESLAIAGSQDNVPSTTNDYAILRASIAAVRYDLEMARYLYTRVVERSRRPTERLRAFVGLAHLSRLKSNPKAVPALLDSAASYAKPDVEGWDRYISARFANALATGAQKDAEVYLAELRRLQPTRIAPWIEVRLLDYDGEVAENAGEHSKAMARYEAMKQLYYSWSDTVGIVQSLFSLSEAQHVSGRPDLAGRTVREALRLSREMPFPLGIANSLGILLAYESLHDEKEARRIGVEAVAYDDSLQYLQGLGNVLRSVGWLEFRRGNVAPAKVQWSRARRIFQTLDDNKGLGNVSSNLATILARQDSIGAALLVLQEGRDASLKAGDLLGYYNSVSVEGQIEFAAERYDNAAEILERSIAWFQERGIPQNAGAAIIDMAETCIKLERLDDAEKYVVMAEGVFGTLDDPNGRDYTARARGNLERARGNEDRAVLAYEAAVPGFRKREDKTGLATIGVALGMIRARQGRCREAVEWLVASEEHYHTAQFVSSAKEVADSLAFVRKKCREGKRMRK